MMLRYCVGWGGVGWGGVITFICTSSHIWCYVIVWGGVGWGNNVHLHFLTYMMLRYCMSSCTSSHTWCYATVCRLALPHIHDATLLYVVLHFRSSLEQGKNEERQKTLSFFSENPISCHGRLSSVDRVVTPTSRFRPSGNTWHPEARGDEFHASYLSVAIEQVPTLNQLGGEETAPKRWNVEEHVMYPLVN